MPIYEFYCEECNTIFNFLSRRINTSKRPLCPKCNKVQLQRRMSIFSTIGKAGEDDNERMPDIDESRLESAMADLAREAENINEDDPRQMARVMRSLTEKTGLNLGDGMEEALARMEAGEDPERIEQEMGDLMEGEDPFSFAEKKVRRSMRSAVPYRDETLYEL